MTEPKMPAEAQLVSLEERAGLDRMRGQGKVDWQAVADAFKEGS